MALQGELMMMMMMMMMMILLKTSLTFPRPPKLWALVNSNRRLSASCQEIPPELQIEQGADSGKSFEFQVAHSFVGFLSGVVSCQKMMCWKRGHSEKPTKNSSPEGPVWKRDFQNCLVSRNFTRTRIKKVSVHEV